MTTFTSSLKRLAPCALPALFWLGVWQGAAMLVDAPLLLPAPGQVLHALLTLLPQPDFWRAAAASLGRVGLGVGAGTLLGCLTAALTARFFCARCILAPAMGVVRATPVASFILLVLLWLPRTLVPTVITVLMVTPVLWENLSQGIQAVDRQLLELTRVYRFSTLRTLRVLYLPSLRPYFFSALLSGLGLGWKAGVAAEVLCQPRAAIGAEIYFTKYYFQTPELFAWSGVVILLSLLLEQLLRLALRERKGGVSP